MPRRRNRPELSDREYSKDSRRKSSRHRDEMKKMEEKNEKLEEKVKTMEEKIEELEMPMKRTVKLEWNKVLETLKDSDSPKGFLERDLNNPIKKIQALQRHFNYLQKSALQNEKWAKEEEESRDSCCQMVVDDYDKMAESYKTRVKEAREEAAIILKLMGIIVGGHTLIAGRPLDGSSVEMGDTDKINWPLIYWYCLEWFSRLLFYFIT